MLGVMFWSTRTESSRKLTGAPGDLVYRFTPLLGRGMKALSNVVAMGLTGTMSLACGGSCGVDDRCAPVAAPLFRNEEKRFLLAGVVVPGNIKGPTEGEPK